MNFKNYLIFVPLGIFAITIIWNASKLSARIIDNSEEILELRQRIDKLENKNEKLEEIIFKISPRENVKKK